MKKRYILTLAAAIVLISGCIDEISPDFEFEEQVFISGLLTNETGFVSVSIQKTVAVTDTTFNAVKDARVSLFTRNTSDTVSLVSDSFEVTEKGYTSSEIITPIIGNAYWIEVTLQDQTMLRSEEEILNPPISITDMVKTNNTVRIRFSDPIEEQNFYITRIEVLKDGELISNNVDVFSDVIRNDNSEIFLDISGVSTGNTVRTRIYNINFNTFQFYLNVFGGENDLGLSSLFLPVDVVGNVTNTTINELALGNFGIAGFSTMTTNF